MEEDTRNIKALKMLAIDAISNANSGHPGIVLSVAPMLYTLATRHLVVDPTSPKWINRDRLVLSAGHGSALLYSHLHLSGFDVSINDLKSFRKMGSRTPGHPEFGVTPGVDATTGPLGQGLGMAVGMAVAQKRLEKQFGKLMDHNTFAIVGDGDLMEGISHEAAEFAGINNLNKLVVLYDSNEVSLDGPTSRSFKTNERQRFASYGFDTFLVEDGDDIDAIDAAITKAKASPNPAFIEIQTIIGEGAPNEGTNKVHGAPLNDEALSVLEDNLDWHLAPFEIPAEIEASFHEKVGDRGIAAHQAWEKEFDASSDKAEILRDFGSNVKVDESKLETFKVGTAAGGRNIGHTALNDLAKQVPNLIGGAADLASSTKTEITDGGTFSADNPLGKNIPFGVHEFGMSTIMNGIALHGGLKVFGSTFAVFSDYMKAAIRLSALQKLPVIYIFTHDSIAVGQDGSTHQPIEQLAGLQSIPNLNVVRPGSPNEIVSAWKMAVESVDRPTVMFLSRQDIVELPSDNSATLLEKRGGYVASFEKGKLSAILMATGTELALTLEAQKELEAQNIFTRVVSMPDQAKFMQQDVLYRESVLPNNQRRRIAVEMGSSLGWANIVGLDGKIIGIDSFGKSGASDVVIENFDFTVDDVVAEVKNLLFKMEKVG
ncbi:transketolase [Companilactobacillus mishanensis]|uniref:Transketolase n=1 Tax=Companilactobacillus mishanensis TaxID=2486008 RepID=A0ABW9P6B0_9LACO|nr:transketolase [Companilactobacillus mishanensis]MQS44649.1 transketolase [Companilactobacillus mishanensis]